MAQGKAYTTEEREEIILSLKPYLEMGFSRTKSCSLIGLPPTSLQNWLNEDKALSIRIEGWENMINAIAIKNIQSAIRMESQLPDDLKKENSWKWAERKIKELSPKNESELIIKEAPKPILDVIFENNSDIKDNVIEEAS